MDRQKKPLHHNKTGSERRGGSRGPARLPRAAAEVPEGYFSGWRVPSEKCGAPQPTAPELERNPDNIQQ